MGRASRRKRDRKKPQASGKPKQLKVDEAFTAGPVLVQRAGRFMQITSKWPEGAHEEMKTRARSERPVFLEKARESARDAIALLQEYDPIQLIGHVFLANAVLNAETY